MTHFNKKLIPLPNELNTNSSIWIKKEEEIIDFQIWNGMNLERFREREREGDRQGLWVRGCNIYKYIYIYKCVSIYNYDINSSSISFL